VSDTDDAMMLGLIRADFNHKVGAAGRELAERRRYAFQHGQTPPAAHRLIVLAQPWGWAELLVRSPFDYRIEAIGVVSPGLPVLPDMVEAHRATFWNSRGLPLSGGCLSATVGSAVAIALDAPAGWIALSLGCGAVVGTGFGFQVRRRYGRLRDLTRRIEASSPSGFTLIEAARRFMRIRNAIHTFDRAAPGSSGCEVQERTSLELGRAPEEVLHDIHRALWDLADGQSEDSAEAVLAVIGELELRVAAAVDDAVSLNRAVRVPDPPESAGRLTSIPARRAIVDRLTQAVQDMDRVAEARGQALNEIRRLNGHPSSGGDPVGDEYPSS
jgi:hypothetical protein